MPRELFVLIIIERDGGKYHAYAPGLKGLHVDGRTRKKAAENAARAVCVYINSLHRRHERIPLGPYLKADFVHIDREVVPDDPGIALLQSIPCPSHHTSGIR